MSDISVVQESAALVFAFVPEVARLVSIVQSVSSDKTVQRRLRNHAILLAKSALDHVLDDLEAEIASGELK